MLVWGTSRTTGPRHGKDSAAVVIQKDGKKPVFRLCGLDFKPFRVYIILTVFSDNQQRNPGLLLLPGSRAERRFPWTKLS